MSENYLLDVLTEARKPHRRYTRVQRGGQVLAGVTLAFGLIGYFFTDYPGIGIIFLAAGMALAFGYSR